MRELAELGLRIERHYGAPQDTEWAFDPDGKAWMLQSRPVTTGVAHAGGAGATANGAGADGHARGSVLARGLGAAPGVAAGPARVVTRSRTAARCATATCSSRR